MAASQDREDLKSALLEGQISFTVGSQEGSARLNLTARGEKAGLKIRSMQGTLWQYKLSPRLLRPDPSEPLLLVISGEEDGGEGGKAPSQVIRLASTNARDLLVMACRAFLYLASPPSFEGHLQARPA